MCVLILTSEYKLFIHPGKPLRSGWCIKVPHATTNEVMGSAICFWYKPVGCFAGIKGIRINTIYKGGKS